MLIPAVTLNALLMIALPLALVFYFTRRFHLGWGLAGAGALTFIASQWIHLPILFGLTALFKQFPLNLPKAASLPFNAVALGLLAGLCEELARYLAYRRFLPAARSWGQGLVFGAGHGGIESILLGAAAGLQAAQLIVLHSTDPSAWGVPAAQLPAVQAAVAAFWASPWYAGLLGALERVFALCVHLSASVLVLQAFTRRNLGWLAAAIGWHALVDGVAVYAAGTWGAYGTEALVAAFAVIGLVIIFALRDRPVPAPPASPAA